MIEYIIANYDKWNNESLSDTPDKMIEELEDLVPQDERFRFLLGHAGVPVLRRWITIMNEDFRAWAKEQAEWNKKHPEFTMG
jgi:hypothetical protein